MWNNIFMHILYICDLFFTDIFSAWYIILWNMINAQLVKNFKMQQLYVRNVYNAVVCKLI